MATMLSISSLEVALTCYEPLITYKLVILCNLLVIHPFKISRIASVPHDSVVNGFLPYSGWCSYDLLSSTVGCNCKIMAV
jgi:hypothetical protein